MLLQHTVEQDRAPAVLSHHPELARPAADRSPRRRRINRRDNDQDRTEGRLRARHAHLPKGHQSQQCRDEGPKHHRRSVPSWMELQDHAATAATI